MSRTVSSECSAHSNLDVRESDRSLLAVVAIQHTYNTTAGLRTMMLLQLHSISGAWPGERSGIGNVEALPNSTVNGSYQDRRENPRIHV